MELIVALALLILLDIAALRWGVDTLDTTTTAASSSWSLDRDRAARAPVTRHGVLR